MTTAITKSKPMSLTLENVKKYISVNATEGEVVMFLELCKAQNLNPFIREAYLIKYGNYPASIVVGKETFTKRAERHIEFDGFDAGIVLANEAGGLDYRTGSLLTKEEDLAGGYAEVYRKDKKHPFRCEVSFTEYATKDNKGNLTKNWREKPATMIRKVALVQALREAFPNELGGMYTQEEVESGHSGNGEQGEAIDIVGETKAPTENIPANSMLLDLIRWNENQVFDKASEEVATKLGNFLRDAKIDKDAPFHEFAKSSGHAPKQIEKWHTRCVEFARENDVDLNGGGA